jgi:hypothetical protein
VSPDSRYANLARRFPTATRAQLLAVLAQCRGGGAARVLRTDFQLRDEAFPRGRAAAGPPWGERDATPRASGRSDDGPIDLERVVLTTRTSLVRRARGVRAKRGTNLSFRSVSIGATDAREPAPPRPLAAAAAGRVDVGAEESKGYDALSSDAKHMRRLVRERHAQRLRRHTPRSAWYPGRGAAPDGAPARGARGSPAPTHAPPYRAMEGDPADEPEKPAESPARAGADSPPTSAVTGLFALLSPMSCMLPSCDHER